MGTNFYLMSRNKKLMREHFAVETEYDIKDIEYAIVDEPYLGYEIHLNKLSWGWRPLFQRHKTINTFKELEEFCLKNKAFLHQLFLFVIFSMAEWNIYFCLLFST